MVRLTFLVSGGELASVKDWPKVVGGWFVPNFQVTGAIRPAGRLG